SRSSLIATPLAFSHTTLVFSSFSLLFFFNDTATTEIYTLSLHDALPICRGRRRRAGRTSAPRCRRRSRPPGRRAPDRARSASTTDRKSTRLNSSHVAISYAVFCLKKKKKRNG